MPYLYRCPNCHDEREFATFADVPGDLDTICAACGRDGCPVCVVGGLCNGCADHIHDAAPILEEPDEYDDTWERG